MIGALILGLLAGVIARALVPGRDPMGLLGTLLLGLVGSALGFALLAYGLGVGDGDAFDLGGLVGAVIGSAIALLCWRALQGRAGAPHAT